MGDLVRHEPRGSVPALPSLNAEQVTIAAVVAAAEVAFNPRGEREITAKDIVVTCAALTVFLGSAASTEARSLEQWKADIEGLRLALGGSSTPQSPESGGEVRDG